jgi:hypothetical protein
MYSQSSSGTLQAELAKHNQKQILMLDLNSKRVTEPHVNRTFLLGYRELIAFPLSAKSNNTTE